MLSFFVASLLCPQKQNEGGLACQYVMVIRGEAQSFVHSLTRMTGLLYLNNGTSMGPNLVLKF